MQNHSIVHMDLDSFFVSVARLEDSNLNGKPIIIGGTSDRGVVTSCSYEARKFGITSAMPSKLARQLCPHGIFIKGDIDRYSYYSNTVTEIIAENTPLYEKSSIDEFYLDLSGMDRFFGCYKWAKELRKTIQKETGLPISFGLSTNKTVAKVATGEAKPYGELYIKEGQERLFLAPLITKKIPMVGHRTYQVLRDVGIRYVKAIQDIPATALEPLLGKNGHSLWKKANGIDSSPIVPYREGKSMSTERTFDHDTIDVLKLKGILVAMAEKLSRKLRSETKVTSCVTVKIRYSNFDTYTLQNRISYTSCDHTIIDKAKELFDKLYNKRLRIRLIGLKVSHLVHGGYQINIFEDTQDMIALYQVMDRIQNRFGDSSAVKRAIGMDFKHRKFNPFNGK